MALSRRLLAMSKPTDESARAGSPSTSALSVSLDPMALALIAAMAQAVTKEATDSDHSVTARTVTDRSRLMGA
jgi:hypothetical protein